MPGIAIFQYFAKMTSAKGEKKGTPTCSLGLLENIRAAPLATYMQIYKKGNLVDIKEMLLLLTCFSHVRLCATPQTTAHQAPLSLGFSRQEHWSRLPFPSPMHESESEVAQSCLTLSDPMDCTLPGSSVHGFSRQEYWSGLPVVFPTFFNLSLNLAIRSSWSEPQSAPGLVLLTV